jgi:hypothetical protein
MQPQILISQRLPASSIYTPEYTWDTTTHQTSLHRSLGETQDERASAIVDRLKNKSGLDHLLPLFVSNLNGLGVHTQHKYRP